MSKILLSGDYSSGKFPSSWQKCLRTETFLSVAGSTRSDLETFFCASRSHTLVVHPFSAHGRGCELWSFENRFWDDGYVRVDRFPSPAYLINEPVSNIFCGNFTQTYFHLEAGVLVGQAAHPFIYFDFILIST